MNQKILKTIYRIIDVSKFLTPLLGVIYLLIWVIQLFNEKLFKILDKFFGFFPNLFNKEFDMTADIFGRDIPMGYPYIAITCIFLCWVIYYIEKYIIKITKNLDFAIDEFEPIRVKLPKLKLTKKQKKEKIKKIPKNIQTKKPSAKSIDEKIKSEKIEQRIEDLTKITAFYGLLTFKIESLTEKLNEISINEETKKALQHSYTKIIVKKLKEKYEDINYAVSDKLFFICNNVSLFNLFVRDIVKLNKVIARISEEQEIKTSLKLSFFAHPKATPKTACSILLRINNLDFLNKVIVSKYIQRKFDNQLIKCFDFCPLGTVKLAKLNANDKEFDIELYYLKTMSD